MTNRDQVSGSRLWLKADAITWLSDTAAVASGGTRVALPTTSLRQRL